MSTYLLFVDESGSDEGAAPYHVLAGVAIELSQLWPFTQEVWRLQELLFGTILRDAGMPELKTKKILGRRGFRKAARIENLPLEKRKELVERLITKHKEAASLSVTKEEYAAWAQALIEYADRLLALCNGWELKVFATLYAKGTLRPDPQEQHVFLGKEVVFLLQRFFEYLQSLGQDSAGLLVMDELERTSCKQSLQAIARYFARTERGREWASYIVPEPFYVHSDLTTMLHIADLVAYVINWAYRIGPIREPSRKELFRYARLVRQMVLNMDFTDSEGEQRSTWSVYFISDLRPADNRDG